MSGGRFLPASEFNPKLILLQILAIQSAFYFSFISSTAFVGTLFGLPVNGLKAFFDFSSYSSPWFVAMLYLNLVGIAFLLPHIIERTRKCLDFVLTLVVIHLLISWLAVGFPNAFSWWAVWIAGAALCTLLGEWLCMREEQREIRLGSTDLDESDKINTVAAVELGQPRQS